MSNAKKALPSTSFVLSDTKRLSFGPLQTINNLQNTWSELKPNTLPVVRKLIIIDTTVTLIVMLYGMVIGFLIWKGSPRGRRFAQQYLVIRILVGLVVGAIPLQWAYREFGVRAASIMSTKIVPGMVLEIAVSLLWLAYFIYSRRVREAYSTP